MLQVTTWSRAWHTSFLAEPGCLASSESACPFCLVNPRPGRGRELLCVQWKPEKGLFQVSLEYAKGKPSVNSTVAICGRGRALVLDNALAWSPGFRDRDDKK